MPSTSSRCCATCSAVRAPKHTPTRTNRWIPRAHSQSRAACRSRRSAPGAGTDHARRCSPRRRGSRTGKRSAGPRPVRVPSGRRCGCGRPRWCASRRQEHDGCRRSSRSPSCGVVRTPKSVSSPAWKNAGTSRRRAGPSFTAATDLASPMCSLQPARREVGERQRRRHGPSPCRRCRRTTTFPRSRSSPGMSSRRCRTKLLVHRGEQVRPARGVVRRTGRPVPGAADLRARTADAVVGQALVQLPGDGVAEHVDDAVQLQPAQRELRGGVCRLPALEAAHDAGAQHVTEMFLGGTAGLPDRPPGSPRDGLPQHRLRVHRDVCREWPLVCPAPALRPARERSPHRRPGCPA